MVVTDTISDMLTTIRNGLSLSKEFVCTPSSKLKLNVLKVLQEEGYIASFKENEIQKGIKEIKITLSYINGNPSIKSTHFEIFEIFKILKSRFLHDKK